ncbi:MAG: hypothetical protein ACRDJY_01580 [Thermoleophilaceae bacterium]
MTLPSIPRRAVLLGALLAVVLGPAGTAAAQTDTTSQTPPPTTTTPAPTPEPEPEPAPPPPPPPPEETPEDSPAPGEYVETLPTGSGSSPTSPQTPSGTAPSTITPTEATSVDDEVVATAKKKAKKQQAKKEADKNKREHVQSETPVDTRPSVPAAPASTDVGNSARFVWLGLALLAITGGIVSTAIARRRRVVT